MNDMTIVLIDGNGRRRSALAAFLGKRGFAVEAADDPAWLTGPGREAGAEVVLVVSLPDPSDPVLASLREWRSGRSAAAVIGLVPPDRAEAMVPLLESGLIDQIAAPGPPAGV